MESKEPELDLAEALKTLLQEVATLRTDMSTNVQRILTTVGKVDASYAALHTDLQALHTDIRELNTLMLSEFAFQQESKLRKKVTLERGQEYTTPVVVKSIAGLGQIVTRMSAFLSCINDYDVGALKVQAPKELAQFVDAMLLEAVRNDDRFPESLAEVVEDKRYSDLADALRDLPLGEFSALERATIKSLVKYYSLKDSDARAKMFFTSTLGIQALRFHFASSEKKRILETETWLDFGMTGGMRRESGGSIVVEAADAKSAYSTEAVEHVALCARALGWCVKNMVPKGAKVWLQGSLYLCHRREVTTMPGCKVGAVSVNVHYLY